MSDRVQSEILSDNILQIFRKISGKKIRISPIFNYLFSNHNLEIQSPDYTPTATDPVFE